MSMIENLEFIKEQGIDRFLEKEEAKWLCSECGKVICCHNGLCLNCSLDKLRQNKKYRWSEEQIPQGNSKKDRKINKQSNILFSITFSSTILSLISLIFIMPSIPLQKEQIFIYRITFSKVKQGISGTVLCLKTLHIESRQGDQINILYN